MESAELDFSNVSMYTSTHANLAASIYDNASMIKVIVFNILG